MNKWWFTADNHFGHDGIIGHTGRPFTHVDDMDEELIRQWNNHVLPGDIIVICGDFCLEFHKGMAERYIDMLNGNKIFIKGNHDHWFKKEKRYEYHKKVGGVYIYATHYPLRTWPRSFQNGWNLHGHCHANLTPIFYNQLDVGVDRAYDCLGEYRPFSFAEVNEWIEKQNKEWLKNNKLKPYNPNNEMDNPHWKGGMDD
jgi:calcineurin-like phosphoesterase family protein